MLEPPFLVLPLLYHILLVIAIDEGFLEKRYAAYYYSIATTNMQRIFSKFFKFYHSEMIFHTCHPCICPPFAQTLFPFFPVSVNYPFIHKMRMADIFEKVKYRYDFCKINRIDEQCWPWYNTNIFVILMLHLQDTS